MGGGGMDSTHRLPAIIQFYRRQQRMPSLGERQRLCGFKSRTAAEKVAGRLVTLGLLAKDKTGRYLLLPSLRCASNIPRPPLPLDSHFSHFDTLVTKEAVLFVRGFFLWER